MVVEQRRVYRPNDLRERYGLSRDVVFKLIARGELRSFTIGRARFITAEAVEEFIREREQAAD